MRKSVVILGDGYEKGSFLAIAIILVPLLADCAGGEKADETPPAVSAILVSDTTRNSVIITWTTDDDSTSQVECGLTKHCKDSQNAGT